LEAGELGDPVFLAPLPVFDGDNGELKND